MGPVGKVTCHNNHTVDITITNVDDLSWWNETDWRLQNNPSCKATFGKRTVSYDWLRLPDCASSSQQLPKSIKYILEIIVKRGKHSGAGQMYVYDYLFCVLQIWQSEKDSGKLCGGRGKGKEGRRFKLALSERCWNRLTANRDSHSGGYKLFFT